MGLLKEELEKAGGNIKFIGVKTSEIEKSVEKVKELLLLGE